MSNRVREYRKRAGQTQQQAADALGINRRGFQFIEYGTHDPRLPLAAKMARHFGTTVEHLFGYDDVQEGTSEYTVMVQRGLSVDVAVRADSPQEAADKVGRQGFPLPDLAAWSTVGWYFRVHDENGDEVYDNHVASD